jgi:hypothetical protein
MRSLFLQRPGTLYRRKSHWTLQVQPDVSDILLADIPWPLDHLMLPWLEAPIKIE